MRGTRALYITFDGIADPLGQSQVLPYLKSLSRLGLRFDLISFEKDLNRAKDFSVIMKDAKINWHHLKYFEHNFFLIGFNVVRCTLLSLYLVLTRKIKIIHCRSYLPMFPALLLKKIFRVKIIFDMRGFWPEGLVETKRIKKNSICYKMLKFLEKKSILLSDYIVVLTPEAKEIIEERYKGKKLKIIWMPTCVDKNKFNAEEPIFIKDKFVTVYSGSLWSHYDAEAMIDFFKAMKTKIANAHFLVLGNGGTERLQDLFSQKGVEKEDYTILTVEPKEVAKYLLGSNVGISFRYDRYSEKATFPTKLAEYFISGLPVVMNSKSDYIKDFVSSKKLGVILEKFDDSSYQKAVESLVLLLKDRDLEKRCREVAEKYLEKSICVNKYIDIYRELE